MRIDRHAPNRFSPTPDSASYRTRPGDTLRRIAERLGVRLTDLAAVNPHVGSADAPLPPDQVLQLPAPQVPSVASRNPSPTSFRVEYERVHPNVFQRLTELSPFGRSSSTDVAGPGPSGGGSEAWESPSIADPSWMKLFEAMLSRGASTLKLVKALKDFYTTLQADEGLDPNLKVRVGQVVYRLALQDQARNAQNAQVLSALTKFVGGLDGNYRRYRGTFKLPPDLAMGLAVLQTFFQQQGNSILMGILKDAYPQYFPKSGVKFQVLDLVNAALGFSEKVLGIEWPQSFKDAFKVLKYLPATAVASLVGDTVKVMGDVLVALGRSSVGDLQMWDEIATAMLNQEYGPAFQGFAFLADLLITGGRNIEKVPMNKILFADLFDTGPVFRATPQLDRFLRTLREPAFLYGLYQTGQLNPADVAAQLFIEVEKNGVRSNFVSRLESALEAVIENVRMGRRSYEEWVKFREVVSSVVAEVLGKVALLGPAWTHQFRQVVAPDALQRLYRRLNDPVTDRDLQTWVELHGTAQATFWNP